MLDKQLMMATGIVPIGVTIDEIDTILNLRPRNEWSMKAKMGGSTAWTSVAFLAHMQIPMVVGDEVEFKSCVNNKCYNFICRDTTAKRLVSNVAPVGMTIDEIDKELNLQPPGEWTIWFERKNSPSMKVREYAQRVYAVAPGDAVRFVHATGPHIIVPCEKPVVADKPAVVGAPPVSYDNFDGQSLDEDAVAPGTDIREVMDRFFKKEGFFWKTWFTGEGGMSPVRLSQRSYSGGKFVLGDTLAFKHDSGREQRIIRCDTPEVALPTTVKPGASILNIMTLFRARNPGFWRFWLIDAKGAVKALRSFGDGQVFVPGDKLVCGGTDDSRHYVCCVATPAVSSDEDRPELIGYTRKNDEKVFVIRRRTSGSGFALDCYESIEEFTTKMKEFALAGGTPEFGTDEAFTDRVIIGRAAKVDVVKKVSVEVNIS